MDAEDAFAGCFVVIIVCLFLLLVIGVQALIGGALISYIFSVQLPFWKFFFFVLGWDIVNWLIGAGFKLIAGKK